MDEETIIFKAIQQVCSSLWSSNDRINSKLKSIQTATMYMRGLLQKGDQE